jgi:hypothetical protein
LGVTPLDPGVELPQPAASSNSRANALTGIKVRARRLQKAISAEIEMPKVASVSGHRSRWIRPVGRDGAAPDVRDVVEITREAAEFAETVRAGQAAPFGSPEQATV